jgi:hypothetical protein
VYGALAVILIALAGFFMLAGGEEEGAAPVPTLVILQPPAGAVQSQPVSLSFDAGAPLEMGPSGWGAGGRHLHVRFGGSELMPGAGDILPDGGTRYRWTLPRVPPGPGSIQLFWSDAAHRPLRAGASGAVPVELR